MPWRSPLPAVYTDRMPAHSDYCFNAEVHMGCFSLCITTLVPLRTILPPSRNGLGQNTCEDRYPGAPLQSCVPVPTSAPVARMNRKSSPLIWIEEDVILEYIGFE